MIAYLPELHEDELVYSWFARYFAHMYPSYTNAVEDLLENRHMKADVEFLNRLNTEARNAITKVASLEELILHHTMFPYFRFGGTQRLSNALHSMMMMKGNVYQLLPMSKGHPSMNPHYIKYCPVCAMEMRDSYGEAYWNRRAVMRNMDVCTRHKCRLRSTGILICGNRSPRLYVAEEQICDMSMEPVEDGLELQFCQYMEDVFLRPVCFGQSAPVGEFLKARLGGTKYMSARGMQLNTALLLDDLMGFYVTQEQDIPKTDEKHTGGSYSGITKIHHLLHIFSGQNTDFYWICQLAFFLGITPEELVNPALPEKTQTMVFADRVAELRAGGLGCYRIARELGCSASTVRHADQPKKKRIFDYSAARSGKYARDWGQYDIDMLPEVQKAVEQIYGYGDKRPKRVTEFAVIKYMGWPSKRLEYLPKCRELVRGYYEEFPVYWAREVVWCYFQLKKTKEENDILWRDIRDITNLRKKNFTDSFPYLTLFTDEHTADRIRSLI